MQYVKFGSTGMDVSRIGLGRAVDLFSRGGAEMRRFVA